MIRKRRTVLGSVFLFTMLFILFENSNDNKSLRLVNTKIDSNKESKVKMLNLIYNDLKDHKDYFNFKIRRISQLFNDKTYARGEIFKHIEHFLNGFNERLQ